MSFHRSILFITDQVFSSKYLRQKLSSAFEKKNATVCETMYMNPTYMSRTSQ